MIIKILETLFVISVIATFMTMFMAAATINLDMFLIMLSFGFISYILFAIIEKVNYDREYYPSCKKKNKRK